MLGVLAVARDMTKQQEAFEAGQRKLPRPERSDHGTIKVVVNSGKVLR